jgi:hypothetical protein
MPASCPRAHVSSPDLRRCRRRPWRALLAVFFPAVLFAQSTTFEFPIERAGHTFSLTQKNEAPIPLTLEITEPLEDGTRSMNSRLLLSTGQGLFNDYFITDESTLESTSPNRAGTATFFRRSFLGALWFNGNDTPGTNFFVSLPEARNGHQFSIFTSNTQFAPHSGSEPCLLERRCQWQ